MIVLFTGNITVPMPLLCPKCPVSMIDVCAVAVYYQDCMAYHLFVSFPLFVAVQVITCETTVSTLCPYESPVKHCPR